MPSSDFLHRDVETKLSEYYIAAGAPCELLTNSDQVLQAARETFLPLESPVDPIAFSMRLWVDEESPSQPPWPKPYVRGSAHIVFAGFDQVSSLLINLRSRRILGRFSPAMAEDQGYCKTVIFPMLLTIVSATVGIAELHCACVAKNEKAVLLVGPSGTGKSTLSIALSKEGFGFISDDRTFCSLDDGDIHVWGLPTRVKLRAEALRWFRELEASHTAEMRNAVAEVWLEPEILNNVRRTQRARLTSTIFLERVDTQEFCLSPLSATEALDRLMLDLMPELPDAVERRTKTIRGVIERPCWLLRYGGPPQSIARQILSHLVKAEERRYNV